MGRSSLRGLLPARPVHSWAVPPVGPVASSRCGGVCDRPRRSRPSRIRSSMGPAAGLGNLRLHGLLLRHDRWGVPIGGVLRCPWLRVQRIAPRGGTDTEPTGHGASLKGSVLPSGRVGKRDGQPKLISVAWVLCGKMISKAEHTWNVEVGTDRKRSYRRRDSK